MYYSDALNPWYFRIQEPPYIRPQRSITSLMNLFFSGVNVWFFKFLFFKYYLQWITTGRSNKKNLKLFVTNFLRMLTSSIECSVTPIRYPPKKFLHTLPQNKPHIPTYFNRLTASSGGGMGMKVGCKLPWHRQGYYYHLFTIKILKYS